MHFPANIKLLRQRRQRTQDVVASELGFSRSTLNSYENGSIKNPTLDALVLFSKYYRISIDTLVKVDMQKLSNYQLRELEKGYDTYVTGSRLRVLATTVDNENNENIEAVPIRAKAGYKRGFADPEYIGKLPTFQLPILLSDRKYRMFQLSGDSMLPVPDKSWVIGEFIENWYNIKSGQACILLTLDEGIVFKLVDNRLKKHKKLTLRSLNPAYQPYDINVNEVREIWKFCNYISSELPESLVTREDVVQKVQSIELEMKNIRELLR